MFVDWNLNFILDNIRIQKIKNILQSDNLINIVRSPTRIPLALNF